MLFLNFNYKWIHCTKIVILPFIPYDVNLFFPRRQVGEIAGVLIEKCLPGRSTTKDKATKCLLALMEAGYMDAVLVEHSFFFFFFFFFWVLFPASLTICIPQTQLLKGCANKVPKIVEHVWARLRGFEVCFCLYEAHHLNSAFSPI